eukprot:scaffold69_cov248-Pinguiococcus_pyrenoidosus.AAC.6
MVQLVALRRRKHDDLGRQARRLRFTRARKRRQCRGKVAEEIFVSRRPLALAGGPRSLASGAPARAAQPESAGPLPFLPAPKKSRTACAERLPSRGAAAAATVTTPCEEAAASGQSGPLQPFRGAAAGATVTTPCEAASAFGQSGPSPAALLHRRPLNSGLCSPMLQVRRGGQMFLLPTCASRGLLVDLSNSRIIGFEKS